jgi:acetate kinase
MNILVINAGSSSIKYQLIDMSNEETLTSGIVERIGLTDGVITHKTFVGGEKKHKEVLDIPNHTVGLNRVAELLTDKDLGVISDPSEIKVVGHRVVHGGEAFKSTTVITDEVKAEIEKLFPLAPLHNPANLTGIEVAEKVFSNATQVAVFDTAFHATMPAVAYRYAVPTELYENFGIRKYGFHGTSHKYVSEKAIEYLGKKDAKVVTIHIGNGASMAAVDGGVCIDTTMGLGPLSGLIMGTRSGDIDPSIIFYLVEQKGYSIEEVSKILNKESGMYGITGKTDMREIESCVANGDEIATLSYNMYTYRIKQFIGNYAAAMNGLDAIVFTAGVGENDTCVREMVCRDMQYFGFEIDDAKNSVRSGEIREINKENSRTKVLVIPTNEELEIAKQSLALMDK